MSPNPTSSRLIKCRNTQKENGEVGVNGVRTEKYLGVPGAERQGSYPKRDIGPCQHLDFRLVASRATTEFVFSHSVCDAL